MKKLIIYILLLGSGLATASYAHASSIIFEPNVITAHVGQTFTLPITIDPGDSPQYTVRLDAAFPPNVLEVTAFSFSQDWLAIPQPGYDSINNQVGQLIKTAGWPKGFSAPQLFGTITFRAKQAGDSAIVLGLKSFVLDAKNISTLESRPQTRVFISEGSAPQGPSLEPLPNLPVGEQNLFDISLTPEVQTTGAGLVSKVAPGELLPISVKLLNFGSNNRVDVTVAYEITDEQGTVIYSSTETVAVQTTANFIKTIQIPFETPPGRYIAKSSISYQGQVVPATTEFPFVVERKIFGLFQSAFYLYGGGALLVIIIAVILSRMLIKRRRATRLGPLDYSDVPAQDRVFYELISDTISGMRQQVGQAALDIASQINGLVIDGQTGRVLRLTEKPSKVVTELVSGYEKALGKKVSFSFRKY